MKALIRVHGQTLRPCAQNPGQKTGAANSYRYSFLLTVSFRDHVPPAGTDSSGGTQTNQLLGTEMRRPLWDTSQDRTGLGTGSCLRLPLGAAQTGRWADMRAPAAQLSSHSPPSSSGRLSSLMAGVKGISVPSLDHSVTEPQDFPRSIQSHQTASYNKDC